MPSLWNLVRTSALRKVYATFPEPVKVAYRRLVHLPGDLTWRFHSVGRARTLARLAPLKNRFRGHRAVLIGNGPSLRCTDLSALAGEFLIGTNRIYLLASETGLSVDLYVCVNHLVLRQFHSEIREYPVPLKLVDWRHGYRYLAGDPRAVFIPERPEWKFHPCLSTGWNHGFTVTFAAMQAAYFLGFSEVYLVGVDHRFKETGIAMRETSSTTWDSNHFSPDYFGPGVQWQLPNLPGSESSYRAARRAFEQEGRRIIDATVDGTLDVFPKGSLAALASSSYPPASWRTDSMVPLRTPSGGQRINGIRPQIGAG